jgi:16S rRNA (guanine527-N7)-methyltransferase
VVPRGKHRVMGGEPQGRVSRETRIDEAERFCGLVGVDAGHAAALVAFGELLGGVAVARGFIAPRDGERVLERHVLDGVRGAELIEGASVVGDVGSGAGVPGVALAIVAPDVRFELVEPRQARVAFLESVVERLGLRNVGVVHGRVEGVAEAAWDLGLARAFAPIDRAWEVIRPALRPGGRLVFWAGRGVEVPTEMAGASSIDRHQPDPAVAAVLERSGPLIIITA